LFDGRAEAQRGRAGQSGQGPEIADHRHHTARDSVWGPTFPELVEALPGVPIIDRSSVNAFDDPNVAQAIATTGRRKLIFAGISLSKSARRSLPSPPLARASTPMWPSTPPERSARPNDRPVFCACCRPA